MRLHLIGFPHTQVNLDHTTCAYTMKIWKFLKMFPPGGDYEIVLYAPEGSDGRGHEAVTCLSAEERLETFGDDDPNRLPFWPSDRDSALFNARCAIEVRRRVGRHDLLLMTMGWGQRAVHDALSDLIGADRRMLACEPGVGYEGWYANHVAFESHAWQHWLYAKKETQLPPGQVWNGRMYDAVIPNYFDPADFQERKRRGGDYLLFLGRLIHRKGLLEANEIAKATGVPLVVAGPGCLEHSPGRIQSAEGGHGFTIESPGLRYVGVVGVADRAELLAGARCLLAPTLYIEPFGGVAVEAMMAGCPVVSTDWGAFTETVQPGVSGYRFHTLAEGCEAVEKAARLDPRKVREWAMERYSLEAVAPQYDRWFQQIRSLWGRGWYEMPA